MRNIIKIRFLKFAEFFFFFFIVERVITPMTATIYDIITVILRVRNKDSSQLVDSLKVTRYNKLTL